MGNPNYRDITLTAGHVIIIRQPCPDIKTIISHLPISPVAVLFFATETHINLADWDTADARQIYNSIKTLLNSTL